MANHSTIRSILAFAILLIFTFSITPKRYLHDAFAGHSDLVSQPIDDGKVQITQNGFDCDCNTLVATAPFTEFTDEIENAVFGEFPELFTALSCSIHITSPRYLGLRGPPSIG